MIIDQLLLLYYYYYHIIIIIISVIIAIIRILLLLWASCDLYKKKPTGLSNLGAMFDKQHILRSSSICVRLRYFVLSAVSLEKPASHKYVDAKRRSIFKAMSQSRSEEH